MKILVTGGAGFVGSNLVDSLIEKNHEVVVVDNLSTGKKENLNGKAKFYEVGIRDPKISEIFEEERPEAVFHLAAQISVRESVKDPKKDAKINVLGSLNVIQSFIEHFESDISRAKFIFTSTGGAIYGDTEEIPTPEDYLAFPVSPYGIHKLTVEKLLNYYNKEKGLPFTTLRLGNVYGPRQDPLGEAGVVAIFTNQFLEGKQPVIYGDGEQTRDFVYVEDVVKAHLLALKECKNEIFNVGTSYETSINEIFHALKKITDSDMEGKHGKAKPGEQRRSCLSSSKIKKELGWSPKYDLYQGLKKTVEWFKKN